MHHHLFRAEKDDYLDPVARVRQEVESLEQAASARSGADTSALSAPRDENYTFMFRS